MGQPAYPPTRKPRILLSFRPLKVFSRPNENGVNTQTDLGAADSGEIVGNKIIIRRSIAKVNAAVGYNVVGTTATSTQVIAQIVIGALGSGLLFPADVATGSDFIVAP